MSSPYRHKNQNEHPGNHDLVVGAIAEYLSKNGASEVARGLLVGAIPTLKKP